MLSPLRGVAPLLTLLALGCEGPPAGGARPAPVADGSASIVNGSVDEGHPAVVALTTGGQAFCSGTLITPTLVLTAAHCVHPGSTGLSAGDIQVFFGTDVREEGTFIPVIQAVPKPDWYVDDPRADDDIAVLRLAQPGPTEPMPTGPLPPDGTLLTMVGFGITAEDAGDSGTKRITTARIADRDTKIFLLDDEPGATCSGDSGGTALATIDGVETVVGVHTRSDCVRSMINERVDAHADFIAPYLEEPGCDADGQCSNDCDAPDPDCPCIRDGLCSEACPDLREDPDCPVACGGPGNGCAVDCPIPDPDCPVCVADGRCVIGCPADPDPDCVEATAASTVAATTGSGAGGRGDGEGGGAESDALDDDGGCAVRRGPGAPGGLGGAALVAAAASSVARRRRRRA